MGDHNRLEGLVEIPLPGEKCEACNGLGKVLLAMSAEETAEQPCGSCGGKGATGPERALRLRGRVRYAVKAKAEDILELRARRRVFDLKGQMTAEEYQDSLKAVTRECAAGTYSWGGDAWRSWLGQLPGQVALIKLLADDADELARQSDPHARPQRVTEAQVLAWMTDPVVGPMLGEAVRQVMDASPNFLAPPVRGMSD